MMEFGYNCGTSLSRFTTDVHISDRYLIDRSKVMINVFQPACGVHTSAHYRLATGSSLAFIRIIEIVLNNARRHSP